MSGFIRNSLVIIISITLFGSLTWAGWTGFDRLRLRGDASGVAEIRLSNLETIDNLVDGILGMTATTILLTGNLQVTGTTIFGGGVTLTGTLTATDFVATDDIYAADEIRSGDDIFVDDDLNVSGTFYGADIVMTGSITGAVNGTFSGTVQAEQLTSTDDLSVTDAITSASLTATGIIQGEQLTSTDDGYISDELRVGDDVFIDNDLNVVGTFRGASIVMTGSLTGATDGTFSGTLQAEDGIFTDDVYVADELRVNDDVYIIDDLNVTGDFYGSNMILTGSITGATTGAFSGIITGEGLVITDDGYFADELRIDDDVFITDDLNVSGATIITTLAMTGALTGATSGTFSTTIQGADGIFTDDFYVVDIARFDNDLFLTDDLNVSGDSHQAAIYCSSVASSGAITGTTGTFGSTVTGVDGVFADDFYVADELRVGDDTFIDNDLNVTGTSHQALINCSSLVSTGGVSGTIATFSTSVYSVDGVFSDDFYVADISRVNNDLFVGDDFNVTGTSHLGVVNISGDLTSTANIQAVNITATSAYIFESGSSMTNEGAGIVDFNISHIIMDSSAGGESITIGDSADTGASNVTIYDGGSGKMAFHRIFDQLGEDWFIFVATDGTVRAHSDIPTADSDGTKIADQ